MLRLPAVSGRFYPSDPTELTALIREYTKTDEYDCTRAGKGMSGAACGLCLFRASGGSGVRANCHSEENSDSRSAALSTRRECRDSFEWGLANASWGCC